MSSIERMAILFNHKHILEDITGSYILSALLSLIIYSYFCKDY